MRIRRIEQASDHAREREFVCAEVVERIETGREIAVKLPLQAPFRLQMGRDFRKEGLKRLRTGSSRHLEPSPPSRAGAERHCRTPPSGRQSSMRVMPYGDTPPIASSASPLSPPGRVRAALRAVPARNMAGRAAGTGTRAPWGMVGPHAQPRSRSQTPRNAPNRRCPSPEAPARNLAGRSLLSAPGGKIPATRIGWKSDANFTTARTIRMTSPCCKALC